MKRLRSMSLAWRTLLLTSMLVGVGAGPALAQVGKVPPPAAKAPKTGAAPAQVKPKQAPSIGRTGPDALAPTNPDFKPDQPTVQAAPVPAPLPPAVWDVANAEELLRYIGGVGREGLEPTDYDPAGLQAAIQTRDVAATSVAATDRFNRLSSDL